MNLDEAQRGQVSTWIFEGLKLSEIQSRMTAELGLRLTYMEVRLLVDDLKLVPKDPEPAPAASASALTATPANQPPAKPETSLPPAEAEAEPPAAAPGRVSVAVDQLAKPGAFVSGKVTFSDGVTADWQLDQTGRIGLSSRTPGYRPPTTDMPEFQAALESALSRMGF